MLFFAENGFDPARFPDSTLILPAISLGNVGQLAVDLLIHTLNLPRVGFLEAENVIPCCGNDALSPTPSGSITLATEVFFDSGSNCTVVQQRSLYPQGKLREYCEEIASWCQQNKFKQIFLLGGLDSGKRKNFQMEGDQIRYFSSHRDGRDSRCDDLGIVLMEDFAEAKNKEPGNPNSFISDKPEPKLQTENAAPEEETMLLPGPLHGGVWGKAMLHYSIHFWKLFSSLKEKNVPVLALTIFCCEGENTLDSFCLIQSLNALFHFITPPKNWVPPISWSNVFGPSPDHATLFG